MIKLQELSELYLVLGDMFLWQKPLLVIELIRTILTILIFIIVTPEYFFINCYQIQCAVRVSSTFTGNQTNLQMSDTFYAGVKVKLLQW
jgi:hypothetical protein